MLRIFFFVLIGSFVFEPESVGFPAAVAALPSTFLTFSHLLPALSPLPPPRTSFSRSPRTPRSLVPHLLSFVVLILSLPLSFPLPNPSNAISPSLFGG